MSARSTGNICELNLRLAASCLTDYEGFAKEVKSKPISFDVFSDDFVEMRRPALKIHEGHDNVYVKIPITNTRGEFSVPLIERLAGEDVKLNITAMLMARQVTAVVAVLDPSVPSIVSVFTGRIADTWVDPSPIMKEALEIVRTLPNAELLWASVREVLNVFQVAAFGCHIVTVPHDILKKPANSGAKTLTSSRSIRFGCSTATRSLPASKFSGQR